MGINKSQQIEVKVCGGSVFGRYPKISLEKTYNMFISDSWLVNYAGYKQVSALFPAGQGRGLFNSILGGFLIVVISGTVYRLNNNLAPQFVGTINTLVGDVYMDENLNQQICIVDGADAWIYNYGTNNFTLQTLELAGLTIVPSYVCYHNTFFLIGSSPNSQQNPSFWYVYQYASPTTISLNKQLSLQTKPDNALVIERLPGKGNNVLVMGYTVCEMWTQLGGPQNYQRVSSFNIDNGIVSPSTVATNDQYICWLAQNENNAPFIMWTDGSNIERISTDGIDYVLSQIQYPAQSTAFFYRQDGHLFYQITFYNSVDNLSLIYDFNTKMFFHVSDENLNYYPARQVVFFRENTYFVSLNDGSLYQMDTDILTYNYDVNLPMLVNEIPRIRICNTIRKPDSDRFRVGQFTFWIEQGVYPKNVPVNTPRVDMSFSKNGNQSFSNIVSRELNPIAQFRNQIRFFRMGQANEFTIQLRFWGFTRVCATNGPAEIY